MNNGLKFLVSLLIGMIMTVTLDATEHYMPRVIADIVEGLDTEVPMGGEFRCKDIPGNPLLYSVVEDGMIVQIGVRVFSETVRRETDPSICDCIERTWLEMLLCDSVADQKKIMSMKRIGMTVDGFPLGSKAFPYLNSGFEIIREAQHMDFDVKGSSVSLSFTASDQKNFRVTVPADVMIIFPFDKKEHEEYLFRKIATNSELFHPDRLCTPSHYKEENGYYVSGGQYYLIDSLSNNVYYRKDGEEIEVVFDFRDPVTSIRNAAMGAVPDEFLRGIEMNIHFRSYNMGLGSMKISLSQIFGYMQSAGMDFFSGSMSTLGRGVLLVFYHPIYQYINMLMVSIPDGCGFPFHCVLPAEFTSFIPQSNIKSLFGN